MRIYLFLVIFFLPLKLGATCPELALIKGALKDIHHRLIHQSEAPLVINDMKFIVRHGEDGKTADDLLGGNFKSYILDRLEEREPGVCRYRVRDDKTPVTGHFILYQQQ